MGKKRVKVAIVTDSTASLAPEDAEREHIAVVPTTIIIGPQVYTQGVDVTGEMITEALANFTPVSTSRPSPELFQSVYENLIDRGFGEIVSIHLSEKISGTIDSARLAAKRVKVPVHVVDSTQSGLVTGYAAGAAARARDAGLDIAGIVAAAEFVGEHSTILLYVDTLEYLKRGGRIGTAAALIGSAFAVKPILTVADGVVAPLEKVRTARRALERLVALAVEARAQCGEEFDIGVQHLSSHSVAEQIAGKLATALELDHVPVNEVGADIGAHLGPGMIAVTIAARPD